MQTLQDRFFIGDLTLSPILKIVSVVVVVVVVVIIIIVIIILSSWPSD